ncbi:dTDP-glucose 4,6-dehydratase [Pelistega indica]|uniref:dTDP-glucose 4,6-dehydratase n=1 Tax=Pelistega indica TaxID=1414851 RepID=V8FQC1_9BURK|nr:MULTISPECIES: dTDP-glucose 4,6-dehydratase [Pelistega]ETD66355.1 dTDP-glucose 4,6-dehydratase [Pelistega indica]
MNILVTGGCGFIGGHFIRTAFSAEGLSQLGFNPIADVLINLDNLSYAANPEGLVELDSCASYHFIQEDILHEQAILSILEKFHIEAIVHFAAQTHVDRSIQQVDPFVQTNVLGTLSILKACQHYLTHAKDIKKRFRMVYVSTDEVYGSLASSVAPVTETAPLKPSNPYSASKAAGEHFVQAWCNTYQIPTIITRCSNNYGVGQYPEKLIPLMLKQALNEQALPIYGNGLQIRDWIAVEDHCRAINCVLRSGSVGEIYNIGANQEVSNIALVSILCRLLDEYKPRTNQQSYTDLITYIQDRPGHDQRYALNTQKIRQELAWTPIISLEQGLKNIVLATLDA